MALDGAFLSCLREELLAALPDARIDKIHQPSREELILSLRRRGGAEKLYFSARANSPRVHFTNVALENPTQPPMFCMLLRKKLSRAAALRASVDGVGAGALFRFRLRERAGGRGAPDPRGGDHGAAQQPHPHRAGRPGDRRHQAGGLGHVLRPSVLPGLPYSPPPAAGGKVDLSLFPPARPARGGGARGRTGRFPGRSWPPPTGCPPCSAGRPRTSPAGGRIRRCRP